MPIRSATLPGKMSLKIPKPCGVQIWLELPCDRGERCGRKQIAEMSVKSSHSAAHARSN